MTLCLSACQSFLASQGASCAHLRSPVSEVTFFFIVLLCGALYVVRRALYRSWVGAMRSRGAPLIWWAGVGYGLCLKCAYQFMRPVLSVSSQPEKHGAYWAPIGYM